MPWSLQTLVDPKIGFSLPNYLCPPSPWRTPFQPVQAQERTVIDATFSSCKVLGGIVRGYHSTPATLQTQGHDLGTIGGQLIDLTGGPSELENASNLSQD